MPQGMHLWVDDTEPVIDEQNRRVVLYVKSKADTLVGVYENSYVWDLKISEDGTKVDYILEFADSKTIAEFGARVEAAFGKADVLDKKE